MKLSRVSLSLSAISLGIFGFSTFLDFPPVLAQAPLSLQQSAAPPRSPSQGDFDWSLVRKNMLDSSGGKDYTPDGGVGKPFHFSCFSYYAPDLEPSYKTERLGFVVSREGEPGYIELEKNPRTYAAWAAVRGVEVDGLADLDGDGHDEFIVSNYGDNAGYLRVFRTFPHIELTQSFDTGGMLFSVEAIETGEAAPKMCIVGETTGTLQGQTYIVRLSGGTAVLEPTKRARYALGDLGWARRCVQSWRLGQSYDIDEALKTIDSYLAKEPGDAEMLAVRAALLSARTMNEGGAKRKADVTASGECADKALALDAKNAWALGVKGYLLTSNGKSKESIEYFDKAIESQPKNPEWYAQRALANEDLGEYEKAKADYTKQIELDPKNNWAFASRAHANFYLDDMPATVADADKALAINKDDCFALKQRGRAYGNLGKDDKALPDLEAAARLEPSDPENFAVLGMCYMRLNQPEKAKEAYSTMLKLDPGNAEAKKALAEISAGAKSK